MVQAGAVGEGRHQWPVHRGLRREEQDESEDPEVPGPEDLKVANVYDWEADPKHVQVLLEDLGLTDCKLVDLPMAKSSDSHGRDGEGTARSRWT